jgi:hypothetical protein
MLWRAVSFSRVSDMSRPKNARSYARSAAAFAVVAVRRDLPLESADTIPMITTAMISLTEEEDRKAVAGSCATLTEGAAVAWVDALPDPAATARLTDMATMASALCISELKEGRLPGDDVGQLETMNIIYLIAEALDLYEGERDRWVEQRIKDAFAILMQDGEAAWDRVRFELERRSYLTGDEVRALIAESDAELERRRPSA